MKLLRFGRILIDMGKFIYAREMPCFDDTKRIAGLNVFLGGTGMVFLEEITIDEFLVRVKKLDEVDNGTSSKNS